MNIESFIIPIYDWTVTIYSNIETGNDKTAIHNELLEKGMDLNEVISALSGLDKFNAGTHICNQSKQIAYILYSRIYNESGFWKIVPHEVDHLVDRISERHDLDIETRGYITGYIYNVMYQLGIIDNLKNYASESVVPELTSDTAVILSDDDLEDEGEPSIEDVDFMSFKKLDVRKILESAAVIYNGSLGTKILKNRFNYPADYLKSFIDSMEHKKIEDN